MKNFIALFTVLVLPAAAFAQDYAGTTPENKPCKVTVDTNADGSAMDLTVDGYKATVSLGADNLPQVIDSSRSSYQGVNSANANEHVTVVMTVDPATSDLKAVSIALNLYHGPALRSCANLKAQ